MNRTHTALTLCVATLVAASSQGCARAAAPSAPSGVAQKAAVADVAQQERTPSYEAEQLAPQSVKRQRALAQPSPAAADRLVDEAISEEDALVAVAARAQFDREAYDRIEENPFLSVGDRPLSTFSIDVDTASYANVRRFLTQGSWPPGGAVRIEELINYFDYDYPNPQGRTPFSVVTEISVAPWDDTHQLVHIGVQGQRVAEHQLPRKNLVFLLDVSGSMSDPNKLPLLKRGMSELVERLGPEDHVSVVVYAGASGLVLPPTSGENKPRILRAMRRLEAGGSTNGGEGIELAYRVARQHYQAGAINRVILATDGDFNVGTTSQSELVQLIEKERESGVFLTVLGFGMGNYQDSTLEKLADHGNGNYAYIDTVNEARKVLVHDLSATLLTIAKDVKIQVEFNPRRVAGYRLVGYENRKLADRDFNDDTKDAGEIGAGHSVTALYEVVPVGVPVPGAAVDALKYQSPGQPSAAAASSELLTVKLRYKAPTGTKSQLLSVPVQDAHTPLARTTDDFRFSAAVAAFGMLLRDSAHKGAASYEMVRGLARGAQGEDPFGYRREFIGLVGRAARL